MGKKGKLFTLSVLTALTGAGVAVSNRLYQRVVVPKAGTEEPDVSEYVTEGRRFVRAFYEEGRVRLPEQHSSGSLFSAAGCNAFVDIPAGTGKLEAGAEVEAVLL